MSNDTHFPVYIYDSSGEPLPGLNGEFIYCENWDTGLSVAVAPTIEDRSNGTYKVQTLTGGHFVGLMDFGPTAYPQYVGYDVGSVNPQVSFTAGGTTVRPAIASIIAPHATQVIVTFTKPVVMTAGPGGALAILNYSIDQGISVTNAISLSATSVLLTTSLQVPGVVYDLTIINVTDLDGNVIA